MRRKGTEGGFSDRVVKALKEAKAFVRKFPSNMYSSGMPDLIVIWQAITAFVELKKEDAQLTPLQRVTMKDIAKAGGFAIRLRINKQEGCDVSYVDAKGLIVPVSTCSLDKITEAIKLADLMFRTTSEKGYGYISNSGLVDNWKNVAEANPETV